MRTPGLSGRRRSVPRHLTSIPSGPHAHVLVARRDGHHAVEPVAAGRGLDLVGDEVAALERVAHAEGAHRDAVRDADGAKLVARDAGLGERRLDAVAKLEDVLVATGESGPRISFDSLV